MKLTIIILLVLMGAAQAQQSFVASSPIPQATTSPKFWNAENKIDFSVLAGQIAVDAITTQRGLANVRLAACFRFQKSPSSFPRGERNLV